MNARDVIADELDKITANSELWSHAIIATLTASGYRILGPGEVDAVTVEVVAKHLEGWGDMYGDNAATAIRALCATHQGDKR